MRKLLTMVLVAALALPLWAALAPGSAAAPTTLVAVAVTPTNEWNYGARVDALAYSPDGRHLAVAIDGGVVEILNATTFALENTLAPQGNWSSASSLSWGPLSDKIGVGYEGGSVVVWRIPAGNIAWSRPGLQYEVRGVAWSPDGKYLAAGIVHSVFVFWFQDGFLNATIPLDYGGSQPAGLSWSHDSDFIAVGQQALSPAGAIVALFDAKSWGKSLGWRWQGPYMDNVAFDGRGRFIAVQLGGLRTEVWEVRNWSLHSNISAMSGMEQFAWTSDGSRLVTLETEPSAQPNQSADLGGFELLRLGGGAGNSSSMAVSPDGRAVAVGFNDGTLRILAIGGDRLFDDKTPLVGFTGDALTFSVAATNPGTVTVSYADAQGGHAATADLTASGSRHALTIAVPSDWSGPLYYTLSQPANGVVAPQRIVRILDNDAPTVAAWNFSRSGAGGTLGTATVTVADNIRIATASVVLAVDGVASAAATAGANVTLGFSLSAAVSEQNRSVRIEVRATDDSGNGGQLLEVNLDLLDVTRPEFGADLSAPGTAGGRVQLGTVAVDARGAPVVNVTWRELSQTAEGPWSAFTYGAPTFASNQFLATFPIGRDTVAIEYAFAAVDAAGNSNATAVRAVTVLDREPPEVVADISDRAAQQGDPFALGVVVRDNIGVDTVVALVQEDGGVTFQVALQLDTEFGEGAFTGSFVVGSGAERISYSFSVTDREGNTVDSGQRQLGVADNDPPEIRVVESVLLVAAGDPFTFHVEASDRSGVGDLTVYFRRVGEQSFNQEEFTASSKSGTRLITARFVVSLDALHISTLHDGRTVELYFFAIDGALNGGNLGGPGDPIRLTVVDKGPPTARIEAAGEFVAGSAVSLDGSGSGDDLGIVEYVWTVDDVPAGNRSAIAWRVTTAGPHTVVLTVRDAAGNENSQTLRITATAPEVANAPVGGTVTVGVLLAAAAAAAALIIWRMKQPKKPEETSEAPPTGEP